MSLTVEEMSIAMKEIGMGKTAKTTSLDLSDESKLRDFEKLMKEMKEIKDQGGVVDMGSDWLGD